MLRVSTALGASFTAALALTGINTDRPVTFGVSKAETSSDAFILYGTLDSAAVDATNAANLGAFTGINANPLPSGMSDVARTYPYLLVKRTGGSTAGTFYATGDAATAPAVVTTAAPSGTSFSSVLTLTTFSAAGVRIGGSAALTVSDVFDLYVTEDSTVTSAVGCQYVGRFSGGGELNVNSYLTKGWPYAIVQRVSGSTVGTIIAAGNASTTLAAGGWAEGGNAFGLPGVLGTTDAQTMSVIANGVTFLTSDQVGLTTTLGVTTGANLTTVQGGSSGVLVGAAGPVTVSALGANTASIISGAGGTVGVATNASQQTVNVGNGVAGTVVSVLCGATTTLGLGNNATDHATTVGTVTGAGLTTVQGGTSGVAITGTGAGPIVLTSGTGTSAWTVGAAGTLNIAADANAHSVNLATGAAVQTVHIADGAAANLVTMGSTTGAAALTLQAGTGNLSMFAGATGNVSIGSTAGSFGNGTRVIFIANDVADPNANPTGGGILYVAAGALKWRGSGGTVTTIAGA